MNCQPVVLNEPLLLSESYQGERGWEVLRQLSYLTAALPREGGGGVLLRIANKGVLFSGFRYIKGKRFRWLN